MRAAAVLLAVALSWPARGEEPPAGAASAWSFAATAYAYFVPDVDAFGVGVATADRGPLHLEARWQYEAADTVSVWAGASFGGGAALEWTLTPLLGLVLGDLDGVAPGYKGSLRWKALQLWSEGEYVFDVSGSEGSFLYSWTELTVSPAEWVRLGVAAQRTRAWASDRDLQRGFMAAFSYGKASLTGYVLNPDAHPTWIVALGAEF